jgi:(p)ppGpp synthase/HD superfamily hydrolase
MTKATLEDAIAFAAMKHKGFVDKAGAPYILHPLRVMGFLGSGASEDERIVAVLHDVPEDCGVSFEELERLGYSEEAVAALRLVTRLDTETYEEFIERLAPNAIARRVKLCDLRDNMDLSRLPQITERDRERLARYERAKAFLEGLAST